MATTKEEFIGSIQKAYPSKSSIYIGSAIYGQELCSEAQIQIPLKTLNRHGLIAGATGTGKTVSLQLLAESLCKSGVPVLLMDLKGDLAGLSQAGTENSRAGERNKSLGIGFHPQKNKTEFLSLTHKSGVPLRATVSEFGPVLFSKILDLNDTQSSLVAMLFKYADDHNLLLLDLDDFKQLLQHSLAEGKAELQKNYGNISSASISTILRKVVELESQGAAVFFGEKSFDVNDLLVVDAEGLGQCSLISLSDIQDKPKLFSTFMLCLLAEIYATFPEAGDLEKPKLCLFIDEAHLLFKNASNALLEQLESIVKLIRSKGVGLFFVTQNPTDIPDAVLSQLGLKVQHALRAFTEKDRKAIKKAAENFPITKYYDTAETLTSLGIGEALVTALDEKGIPTPLAAVRLKAPESRIGTITEAEMSTQLKDSRLLDKYQTVINRESAYEILTKKILAKDEVTVSEVKKTGSREEPSLIESVSSNPLMKQIGRTVARELTRGLLGALGFKTSSGRKRSLF
jgi:DNA helicase HerA-like ATPase